MGVNAGTSLSRAVIAFVHMGLLEFWHRALPGDSAVVNLLQLSIKELLQIQTIPDWKRVCSDMQEALQTESASIPLVRISADYKLSLSQLFTIALVGEAEASHVVNLAIAELQQPDKNPRASLHLVSAMLADLFDDEEVAVFDIAQQKLVQDHVLRLEGDNPLPLKRITIEAGLWSILCGRKTHWPQCTFIPTSSEDVLPQSAEQEIGKTLALLDSRKSIQDDKAAVAGTVVRGNPNSGRRLFASHLAKAMGKQTISIPFELWRDFPVLAVACRYANWLPVIQPIVAPGDALKLVANQVSVPLIVLLGTDGAIEADDFIETTLLLPTQQERQQAWNAILDNKSFSKILAASALLSLPTIKTLAISAKRIALQLEEQLKLSHIAEARNRLGAEKLRLLAQPIFRKVSAKALVMPTLVEQGLNSVILRASKRESLWKGMGETLTVTANPGVRVLFTGESGTGKTLAASYIATSLSAPLYRVDLSAVMNKYIGESEKNLSQLLDQAAANDVVLLFDEADALFGNRSEGKETGERFANMLTNFLLTRIENHPAIVILTTNNSDRIDKAFNRRIDAVIEFPLPGYKERLLLWESHLGERGPGNVVYQTLASSCDLAGGQIRNAVLSAAVYSDGNRISAENIWHGLREEYNKLGRDLPKKLNYLRQPLSVT